MYATIINDWMVQSNERRFVNKPHTSLVFPFFPCLWNLFFHFSTDLHNLSSFLECWNKYTEIIVKLTNEIDIYTAKNHYSSANLPINRGFL